MKNTLDFHDNVNHPVMFILWVIFYPAPIDHKFLLQQSFLLSLDELPINVVGLPLFALLLSLLTSCPNDLPDTIN